MFTETQTLCNEIEDQIEATTEVAKTGNAEELRESIEDLQALLNQATIIDLKCDGPKMRPKFATLHKTLDERI